MSIWIGIGLVGLVAVIVFILALAVFYMNNFNNKKL